MLQDANGTAWRAPKQRLDRGCIDVSASRIPLRTASDPAPPKRVMNNPRRSDFDVTNTVQVSSPDAVRGAVTQLLVSVWPEINLRAMDSSFEVFALMFSGRMPGYEGVDTLYHDTQHTLDITLAMARLLVGFERQATPDARLGAERALVGVITALFHDVGYLREKSDTSHSNGAEFTRNHVSRGARFLGNFLPQVGLSRWIPVVNEIIHFTGYEKPFSQIITQDPRDRRLGFLLGTADMMAQMADRCYLEKCRDRLYPEFVLGGVALQISANGNRSVHYASGLDLLRQTPKFIREVRSKRLDADFDRSYRFLDVLYDGRNPYVESIERNYAFLQQVLRSESWHMLRRTPPVFTAIADPVGNMRRLMAGYISRAWSSR